MNLINTYRVWRSKRSLSKAIKKADQQAKQTGRRYYVVKVDNSGLAVVDNSFIKIYNRKAKRKIRSHELKQMALYATPWTTKKKQKNDL